MKKITILILIICAATLVKGQGFPGTDSLRTYNSKYITTNPATAFTNNRLHTLLRGVIDWIDTARAGTGGGGAVGVDTLWTINDSTIRYRRNGSFYNHILRGVYDTRRKVDTAYALNDSTLQIKINGTNRNIIIPGRHWDLQGILNNGSTLTENENIVLADSLQFTSGAVVIETLRIRGITNSIDTTTYKPVAVGPNGVTVKLDGWPFTPTTASNGLTKVANDIKLGGYLTGTTRISGGTNGYPFQIDSTASITFFSGLEYPSSGIGSFIQMSDSVMNIGSSSATDFTSFVFSPTRIKFTAADGAGSNGDVWTNTGSGYGHWAPPSGGGGTTNLDTTRTSSTVTVSSSTGTDAVILGADPLKAGMLTAETQSIAGRKNILGKTSNFNGYGPRLNTQLLPSTKDADSIYLANKYLGFGFCGVFKSGVRVMVYVNSDNHVGDNSFIMIGKSYDQGRTYITDTLMYDLPDTLLTMGGGGIAPDNRLIIFYKRFRASDKAPIDQRVILSDDEGETLYGDQVISSSGNDEYLPYGSLVHAADDVLLLSSYGNTGATYNVYVHRSTDGGLTWASPVTVFSNTASDRTETSFEHLGGGTIIGLMRSEVGDTLYGQVISYDNGATWAYQGQVAFGISGTPAWLNAFKSQNGKMALACYYRDGTDIKAIYSYADSVILGPSHWDLTKEVTIASDVMGSGYINVCHPYQQMEGWGFYYDETVAQADATIKWVKVPLGGSFPVGVGTGVSGLTAGRIVVASSPTALTDYSTLKYSGANTAIVGNGAAGNTWSGHNGLVAETQKASMVLSDNGYVNLIDNGYIDTDYKYKVSSAAAGLLSMTAGRFHFYNAAAGTAGNNISWTERFRIGAAGDFYINGSAGTSGQVLVSGGAGSPLAYTTYTPSQWVDVTGGINYPTGGGYVGIHNTTPAAPLHINASTSGGNQYTMIVADDNSAIGASIAFGYRSATGTNQRYKGFVMDNNGLNFVKYANTLLGVPTSVMMMTQADNFVVGSTTDNGIGKVQVEGKITVATADSSVSPANMLWRDPNTKEFKLAAVPSGGNGIYGGSGTLPSNVTVSTAGNTLTVTGTNDSETSFSVINTGSTAAGAINGTGGGNGTGVQGESSSGIGVAGISATGAAFRGQINPSSNNAIENAVTLLRTSSSGAGANGLGAAIQYELETATNGTSQTAGSIAFLWSDATNATRTSRFEIYGVNSATTARKAALAGNGQWTWDGYGSGTHTGTPTGSIQTTSAGAIIEGPVLAAGTYTPTLTAVTNTSSPLLDGARYTRVGNIVTFSLRFSVTTSSGSSASSIRVTLPVASSFSNINQAAGTCSGSLGRVEADDTNDELIVAWTSGVGGSETIVVTGQYTIL